MLVLTLFAVQSQEVRLDPRQEAPAPLFWRKSLSEQKKAILRG